MRIESLSRHGAFGSLPGDVRWVAGLRIDQRQVCRGSSFTVYDTHADTCVEGISEAECGGEPRVELLELVRTELHFLQHRLLIEPEDRHLQRHRVPAHLGEADVGAILRRLLDLQDLQWA